jgi:hypothetical protein
MKTDPLVALSSPVTTLMSVVFPDPLGPISPRISPVRSVKLTSLRALSPANDLLRFLSSRVLTCCGAFDSIQISSGGAAAAIDGSGRTRGEPVDRTLPCSVPHLN